MNRIKQNGKNFGDGRIIVLFSLIGIFFFSVNLVWINRLQSNSNKTSQTSEEIAQLVQILSKQAEKLDVQENELKLKLDNINFQIKALTHPKSSKDDEQIRPKVGSIDPIPNIVQLRNPVVKSQPITKKKLEFKSFVSRNDAPLEDVLGSEEMRIASDWMISEIEQRQHPTNCSTAKFHLCNVFNTCGAGCIIHQLAYCFLIGLASQRVTIIGDGWNYLRECRNINSEAKEIDAQNGRWECLFEKMTNCELPQLTVVPWSKEAEARNDLVTRVDLFSRAYGWDNPSFFGWAASDGFHTNTSFWAPEEIKETIKKYHGDYRVWIVSHLTNYILRLNDPTMEFLIATNKEMEEKIQHPMAGLHVRRTDHGFEAPFRELDEYMGHINKWFEDENIVESERRIYIATDEPAVIEQALNKYPKYSWIYYTNKGTKSGNQDPNTESRTAASGTLSLLSDWRYLSQADFFVGTSSSQVSRMAYELMQFRHTNAAKNFISLDDPWYFP